MQIWQVIFIFIVSHFSYIENKKKFTRLTKKKCITSNNDQVYLTMEYYTTLYEMKKKNNHAKQ